MNTFLIAYLVGGLISAAFTAHVLLTNEEGKEKFRHMLTLLPPEFRKRSMYIAIGSTLVLRMFFWPYFSMKAIASYFESRS